MNQIRTLPIHSCIFLGIVILDCVVINLLYYHYPNPKLAWWTDWILFFQPCLFNHNSLLYSFLDTDLISAEGKKQIFNSFLFAAVVVNTSTHTDDSVVCRAAHSKRWNDDTLTEILKFSSLFGTLTTFFESCFFTNRYNQYVIQFNYSFGFSTFVTKESYRVFQYLVLVQLKALTQKHTLIKLKVKHLP